MCVSLIISKCIGVQKKDLGNCDYTWNGLLPLAFESVSLSTVRKFACKSFRYMDAYRKEFSANAAENAVKQYHSNRKIPINNC